MALKNLLANLPEVKAPEEKRLGFNVKLKWTLIILAFFFILSNIPLHGLSVNALKDFEYLSLILGASFGSIMSLGIGPIVTASIVLQLLVGSKLLNIDMTTTEGKKFFQGLQKLLAIAFCIFEAIIYVLMKGLQATPGLEWLLILQLCLGGFLIIFMDEVISKWGFGNGVGLFIVAGVSWQLFTKAFAFLGRCVQGTPGCSAMGVKFEAVGRIPVFITSIINANHLESLLAFAAILVTIIIFFIVVYAQAIKVEVPLSFGRIRGFGIRWPLSFFYTGVIPVILVSALLANVQLVAALLSRTGWVGPNTLTDLTAWVTGPGGRGGLLEMIIIALNTGTAIGIKPFLQAITYILLMVGGSIMFAIFWVKTSGMDAENQAQQITSSGLQIPGFRRDNRVIETILSRYIMPLTIMGGAAVGLLASLSDLGGALVRGTGILLTIMILYKLYEEIAQQHAMDMHPMARKFMAT